MIVEVFHKGSNFKKLYDTFWNIKSIERSAGVFVLATDKHTTDNEDIVLDNDQYELRVSY